MTRSGTCDLDSRFAYCFLRILNGGTEPLTDRCCAHGSAEAQERAKSTLKIDTLSTNKIIVNSGTTVRAAMMMLMHENKCETMK